MSISDALKQVLSSANSGIVGADGDAACELDNRDDRPRKPGIPLLIPCAIAFWATSAIVYSSQISLTVFTSNPPALLVSLLAALIAVVVSIRIRKFQIIVALLFVLLGFLVGCLGTDQMLSLESANPYELNASSNTDASIQTGDNEDEPSTSKMRFTLTDDSSSSQFGSSCIAELSSANAPKMKVLLYLDTNEALYRGQIVEGLCTFSSFDEAMREQYWMQGVSKKATLKDMTLVDSPFPMNVLMDVRKHAVELFAQHCADEAGVLQALVCGYRNTIRESGTYELFKICGIAHIVAVSGAHLAIVASLLMSFLSLLRAPRKITVALEILFLLIYLVFAGIPISALRATFMVVLSMSAFVAKRRAASLNSLAVCIVVFILASPSVAVSLSFFLSAGSVLGISAFSPLFRSAFSTGKDKLDGFLGDQLSLTVSSNVITLPASASLFSQLSLISPVANIVCTPLFSLGCVVGLVCVSIASLIAPLAPIVLFIARIAVAPLVFSVDLLARIPYACIAISPPFVAMIALSIAISVLLWIGWSHFRLSALKFVLPILCLGLAAFLFIPTNTGDRISMLDVGQGDSFLIQSGNHSVLIDTGNKNSMLREAIANRGVRHLDAVVITHPDSDHCESLSSLAGYVEIEEVFVAKDLLACACDHCTGLKDATRDALGRAPRGLSVHDIFKVGSFTFEVVWPYSFSDEGGNADSLSFVVSCDADEDGSVDMKAFFCGDAESEQLNEIMERGDLCDIDILKVGHHGSKVCLDEGLVECMSPSVALIGVGANNRYGHPSDAALDALSKGNTSVFRTDISGSVDISITADEMAVVCEKQGGDFDTNISIAL